MDLVDCGDGAQCKPVNDGSSGDLGYMHSEFGNKWNFRDRMNRRCRVLRLDLLLNKYVN